MIEAEEPNNTNANTNTNETPARPHPVIASSDQVVRLLQTCENMMRFSQAQRVKAKSGDGRWDAIIDEARLIHASLIELLAPLSMMELAGMRLAIRNTAAELGAEVEFEEADAKSRIFH